ncbi:uncharacterized protein LOC115114968 [Oncorhynchus nerka]|uniref:uncharacterized protein LOC115114968 n=1 Tax=Oncorhynchus nerka TaxID=8023 RepID=UPI0011302CB6|nr:uncharacterized protein LOC115114968 [Oncorhynchus nerka]
MMGACCFRLPKWSPLIGYDSQGNGRHGYNTTSNQEQSGRGQKEEEAWFGEITDKRTLEEDGSDHFGYQWFNLTRPDQQRERKEERGREKNASGFDGTDADFIYSCEYLSVSACQARVRDLQGEGEAVSFSPGQRCSEVGCVHACGCLYHSLPRSYGERFRHGCEECLCDQSGAVQCGCSQLTQRKEIRDLTLKERRQYQRAIRRLYAQPGVWDGFTKLRAEFSPQAGGHTYFLPWQRYFLRVVEQELQTVSSCQLGVPYFEWTVDSGDLLTSAVWQPEMFGGDGERERNGERERDEERDRASEGDGEQESNYVSGCVPHHSFQGLSARFHWSPCLRRSFNTSVSVPDAVSVQKLLSQGNFLLFSQALQGLSGLFRLWVGGHMASPLAAYDPLYLSHAAFIDKLWTHWQDRHRDVHTHEEAHGHTHLHTKYPVRQRLVKMKPFGIAPDDVMSSREQLCVVYVPITLGAPCNVTSSLYAERGKGRHRGAKDTASYHRKRQDTQNNHKHSTYDYNAQGYDGFDHSGYNRNGYDRQGFNRMGWDLLGYSKDGLDRDHIDREGYDISGYNRYGFNRHNVTWFGMRWDGLFMREEEREEETQGEKEKESEVREESREEEEREREKVMSELFSDSGYSVYGFDPFGLDRGGFDAFGFRPDGYDKDSCNWFYNGPHYLRFYYHTQQQLISTNQHTLNHITRTCSPITALPQHWPLQDWMALDQEESQALIGQLEREWAGQKHSDDYYTHKVMLQRGRGIWLPITPDSRFCFELHWFSGCPLGSAPMTCPDLCREARCLGNPMAECRLRNCGSCFTEWLDPTTGAYVICQGW